MELLDIFDSNGNKTGRTIVRGDKSAKLGKDEHIAVVDIFIENDKGEKWIPASRLWDTVNGVSNLTILGSGFEGRYDFKGNGKKRN